MRRFTARLTCPMLLAALLVCGTTALGQVEPDDVIRSGPHTWRDILAEPHSRGLIPGALLVVKGPVWGTRVVTVGAADLAEDTPMTLDSPFRVGPLTKAMVAVALLQMETEWKVRLNQTLGELLGDGIVPDADKRTLYDCLFQATGLLNYRDLPEFAPDGPLANDNREWLPESIVAMAVAAGRKTPARKPGDYFPSDTDAILAGMVAERVDKKPLAEILDERVIRKTGLKATYFDTGREVPEAMTRGYTGCVRGAVPRDRTLRHPSADGAAGAVVSTPRDVLTFLETLFETRQLLSQHANAWMFKYINDYDGPRETARGAGVMERTSIRGTFRGVEGSIPGYSTCAGYYLHGDTYILLFINTSDHPPLAQHLYDSLLRQVSGAPNRMEPKQGASVAGPDVLLSWAAGLLYGQFHVYLGKDEAAVSRATVSSHEGARLFLADGDTYQKQVKGLVPGETYFWRVDTFRVRPDHEMDNLRKKNDVIYRKDPALHDPFVAEEEVITGPVFRFNVMK